MQNDEESKLAEELKSLCQPHGTKWKETDTHKSAKTLREIGLLYKTKSMDKKLDNMERKIAFIHSAALLNCALVRDPLEACRKDLQTLCSELLKSAGANNQEFDLLEYSRALKKDIDQWRNNLEVPSKTIRLISENKTKEALVKLEQSKIQDIESLQTQITETYKSTMAKVSDTCISILGQVPCQYALVGMGSMARKEITPYSDFEHMILLQKGVELRGQEERKKIMEYFRWYAVIFQIIVINLGETILPSVAIPSLNDYITEDGDWFFDAFSKRGISFDGFMPHACKSPLGRQQVTKSKPWKTELIKPVDVMLRYLNQEENLKNGYHLADMMTSTCYVAGSKNLYKMFERRVKKTLTHDQQSTKQEIINVIKKDMETYSTKLSISRAVENDSYNIKQFVYRSTTIFITGLAKMHNINQGSCFEIVRKMTKRNLVSPEFAHKLLYAIAVACEIRLKTYLLKESQEDYVDSFENRERSDFFLAEVNEDITSNLIKAVGKQSCYDYFEIALCLQYDVIAHLKLSENYLYFHPVTLCIALSSLLNLYDRIGAAKDFVKVYPVLRDQPGNDEDSHSSDSELQKQDKELNSNDDVDVHREATACFNDRFIDRGSVNEGSITVIGSWYSKMLDFNRLLQSVHSKSEASGVGLARVTADRSIGTENLFDLGKYFFENEVYFEACHCFKTALKWLEQDFEDAKLEIKAKYLHWFAKSLSRGKQLKKAVELLLESLKIYQDLADNGYYIEESVKGDCLYELAKCQRYLDYLNDSCDSYAKALASYKSTGNKDYEDIRACLLYLGKCLSKLRRFNDAKATFKELLDLLSTRPTTKRDRMDEKQIGDCKLLLARCLQNLNEPEDAEKQLRAGFDIFFDLAMDDCNDDAFKASCLQGLGECLMNLNQFENALSYFLQSIEIRQSLSKKYDDETHLFYLGRLYYLVATCYRHLALHSKAVHQLNQFQPIFDTLTRNRFPRQKLVGMCKNIAEIFFELGNTQQAYHWFLSALEQANEETHQYTVAYLNERCGCCLNQIKGRRDDDVNVKNYLETAINLYHKVSQNKDKTYAMLSLKEIGFCHYHLHNYFQAIDFFKEFVKVNESSGQVHSYIDIVEIAKVQKTLALCHLNEKQWDEAFYHLKASLKKYESFSIDSKYTYEIAFLCSKIGRHLMYSNELDEAEKYFEKSTKLFRSIDQTPKVQYESAVMMTGKGDLEKLKQSNIATSSFENALLLYEHAASTFRELSNFKNCKCDLALLLEKIGACQKRLKHYNKAIDSFNQSLLLFETLVLSHRDAREKAYILKQIGFCYQQIKRHDQAIENFLKSNSTLPLPGENAAVVASNLKGIGNSYHAKRKFLKAKSYYRRALEWYQKLYAHQQNYENDITFIKNKLQFYAQ